MKTRVSQLFFVIVFFSSLSLIAQDNPVWFDANWNVSTKSNAVYYRPTPQPKGNGYLIVDYYLDGTVQKEGFSDNKEVKNEKFEGLVKYYYNTGTLYQEVNFKNGLMDGQRKIYYKTGKLKSVQMYEKGKREGKFSEFFESGEQSVIGKYENNLKTGLWRTFYKNGKIKEKGKYENDKKIGVWKTFYKNVYK